MPEIGAIIKTIALYSEEAHSLLQQSLEKSKELADHPSTETPVVAASHGYFSSDDEDEDRNDLNSSSSSESEESDDDEKSINESKAGHEGEETFETGLEGNSPKAQPSKRRPMKEPKRNKQSRQQMWHLKNLRDNLICAPLPLSDDSYLAMPMSLLVKDYQRPGTSKVAQCESFLALASELGGIGTDKKTVVVLLLRSGRFAGGVFEGERCLVHRACQRYTVRQGQGKAQSAQDKSKRKAKSMGAQLRRAGEQNLKEDIQTTILEWKDYIKRSCLILLSCPKAMKASLFSEPVQEVIAREDKRIRKIPFDVGRPTYESVCDSHEVLLNIAVRSADKPESVVEPRPEPFPTSEDAKGPTVDNTRDDGEPKEDPMIPLTALHVASMDGNLPVVLELLSKDGDTKVINIDQLAGPDFMTALHYAAAATSKVDPSVAAACVLALLIQGHADPCAFDARNRPPYFLATHDTVREAFRKARATLGESHCDWERGKVGPPLTDEDIQARKEKEAEKKRRKKAKQKEKKAKEKAQAEDMERQRKLEEEQKKQAEDAKRIRDGLQPRATAATNVCDFCQKVCKGKRRSQMLQRLDYAYCSSDCVQKHKRELMASAALARFG